LDFAYYSKNCNVYLEKKKIIAFFPEFSTILAKKKFAICSSENLLKKIVPSISIPIPPSENSKKYFRVVKFSKMLPTFYRTTTKNENIQFLI